MNEDVKERLFPKMKENETLNIKFDEGGFVCQIV
jgi:hypothetical protein